MTADTRSASSPDRRSAAAGLPETVDVLFERYGPNYRWYVAVVGLSGAAAMLMSATLVNVAVPHVMGGFGIGPDQVQWMATAFLATMTASQLLNAWMISALGQRTTFSMTLILFAIGSLICATAPNMQVLIVGRIMQGFAAGIVQPLVMVTLFQVFPPDKRGLAMGVFGTGVVLAPGLGPTIAGLAIDAFSWRAMFLLPMPFLLIALLAGLFIMPSQAKLERLPRFDWLGYGLLCFALFCVMTGLAHGPRYGWSSDHVMSLLASGVVAGAAFVWWQMRAGGPLLAVELFRNPVFSAAVFVAFVFGAGNFGSTYLIPVFVQEIQGYTATRAGAVMAPAAVLLAVMLPFTGRLADSIPGYVMVLIGLAAFAFGTALMMTSDVNTPFWTFAFFAVISRAGLGFILPSLSSTALRALSAAELPKGSGNMNFIRQLGGASGTNLIVVWLQMQTSLYGDALTATQTAANDVSATLLASVRELLTRGGVSDAAQDGVALAYLSNVVLAQAESLAFQHCFLALAAVFAFALLPAWLLGQAQKRE
jgi:MFS transporter, DHA2 family, multidrug resistance protein